MTIHAKVCVFVATQAGAFHGLSADLFYWPAEPWEIGIRSARANLVLPRWMLDSGRTKWVRSGCNTRAVYPTAGSCEYTTIQDIDGASSLQVSMRTTSLNAFLEATYAVVPAGTEPDHQRWPSHNEWDGWLRDLVAAAKRGGR